MTPTPRRTITLLAMLAAALAAGCATSPAPATIADVVARTPQLSTLNTLIAEAGLAETLRGAGPLTVFAPTDAAFAALPAKTRAELADKQRLKAVLTYHVVPGKLTAAQIKPEHLKTVNGANVGVSKAGAFVTFDEALVVQADVPATNGVVHLIDKVIVAPAPRR